METLQSANNAAMCRADTYLLLNGSGCSHCSMMLGSSAGILALHLSQRQLARPGSSLCKRGVRCAAQS